MPFAFIDPSEYDPETVSEWAEAWRQGYEACHSDSIRNTITPNPFEEN